MNTTRTKALLTTMTIATIGGAIAPAVGSDNPVRVAQGTYTYTADLRKDALRQGSVVAEGITWRCINKQCTAAVSQPNLGLRWCAALVSQVGSVKRYRHQGFSLSKRQLDECNRYAAQEGSGGSHITVGGAGLPAKSIDTSEQEKPGGETVKVEPIQIERVEVLTRGGMTHLYIHGANFPTPRQGRTVTILPNKHPNCYGECAQAYLEYERQLSQAQQGRWEGDVLGVDIYTFRPEPSVDVFFGDLTNVVKSHDVLIRDAAGYQVAHETLPMSEFGFVVTDADGDGHDAIRWHGDDCDDQDASRYEGCEP